MPRNFRTQLARQIGEHLVVAELGRRGVVATPFSGNVPDIDLLAYANGKSVPIQVKAIRRGNPGVDAKRYLDIRFRGEKQRIVGKITGRYCCRREVSASRGSSAKARRTCNPGGPWCVSAMA